MKALVLTDSGPALRRDHPDPALPGEARIRVRLAGVCATDLELVKGYMGFRGVPGHEWVGVVEDAPDRAWIGARVVGDINAACGICATCRAGRRTHCPGRTVLGILRRDGAFAERLSLPVANLHRVPDGVSDEAAVFAEPLAAACEILEQVHVGPASRVIVLGLGRLGQLCARVLCLTGAEVTGVARTRARLDLLPAGVVPALVEDAAKLERADIVVECTGAPEGLALATTLVRPRGTIVLKTTIHGAPAQATTPWVIDEVTLVGSRCGPMAPALRLLAAGLVDPRPLISRRFPLEDALEAFRAAADPANVKVLLDPGS